MSKNKEKNKEDMQELGQMMLENSIRNSGLKEKESNIFSMTELFREG